MPCSVESGLHFATTDGVELRGDLYRPAGPGPHPVLVAASGGAWRRGDRGQLAHWGRYLANQGVAVFATDYRRSEHGKIWPKNLQDVAAALAFVRSDGSRLGLDTDRIGLLGASAGAHLAALAALADARSAPAPLRVLVGVYGVYDLAAHWRADLAKNAAKGEDPTERMLGATPLEDPQLYLEASPIHAVTPAQRAPAVLLIWGESDGDVLPEQSFTFARALQVAGFGVDTVAVPGAGHFWFSREPIEPDTFNGQVAPRLTSFLRENLVTDQGGAAEPT